MGLWGRKEWHWIAFFKYWLAHIRCLQEYSFERGRELLDADCHCLHSAPGFGGLWACWRRAHQFAAKLPVEATTRLANIVGMSFGAEACSTLQHSMSRVYSTQV